MADDQITSPASAFDLSAGEATSLFVESFREWAEGSPGLGLDADQIEGLEHALGSLFERLAERVQRDTLALVVLQGVQANPAALVQVGGNPPTEQVDDTPPPPPDGRPFQQNADGSVSFKPPGA